MFGELIGLWMAAVWKQMGAPENLRIVELGPGRGTLMSDALRAAQCCRHSATRVVLHLVEINPVLEAQQERTLEHLRYADVLAPSLDDVPSGPAIIIANEFFDALPVNQAVKTARWLARAPGRDRSATAISPSPSRRDADRRFSSDCCRQAVAQRARDSIFEWRADTMAHGSRPAHRRATAARRW